MTSEKLSEELEKKLEKAPELQMKEPKKSEDTIANLTIMDLQKVIAEKGKEVGKELLRGMKKKIVGTVSPKHVGFDDSKWSFEPNGSILNHARPNNLNELGMLRGELDAEYRKFRSSKSTHPVSGYRANIHRHEIIKKICPSVIDIQMRHDYCGHWQERILIMADLEDSMKSAFWMVFDF